MPVPRPAPAAIEEPAVAEPELDVSNLSLTAQQKFAALERRLRKQLAAEVQVQVSQRVHAWLQDYVIGTLVEKAKKADMLSKVGRPFTNKEFTSILLRALHPDISSPENRHAAFLLVKEKEVLLRPGEKDWVSNGTLPETVEELLAQKAKRDAELNATKEGEKKLMGRWFYRDGTPEAAEAEGRGRCPAGLGAARPHTTRLPRLDPHHQRAPPGPRGGHAADGSDLALGAPIEAPRAAAEVLAQRQRALEARWQARRSQFLASKQGALNI